MFASHLISPLPHFYLYRVSFSPFSLRVLFLGALNGENEEVLMWALNLSPPTVVLTRFFTPGICRRLSLVIKLYSIFESQSKVDKLVQDINPARSCDDLSEIFLEELARAVCAAPTKEVFLWLLDDMKHVYSKLEIKILLRARKIYQFVSRTGTSDGPELDISFSHRERFQCIRILFERSLIEKEFVSYDLLEDITHWATFDEFTFLLEELEKLGFLSSFHQWDWALQRYLGQDTLADPRLVALFAGRSQFMRLLYSFQRSVFLENNMEILTLLTSMSQGEDSLLPSVLPLFLEISSRILRFGKSLSLFCYHPSMQRFRIHNFIEVLRFLLKNGCKLEGRDIRYLRQMRHPQLLKDQIDLIFREQHLPIHS